MKKRASETNWIPFWGDKWLFGSMRIEFDVAERGVWWDLMALAMKDDGYIRANEDIPYPPKQLAGTLVIEEKFFIQTIEKFIEAGKITRLKNGTLYITNWDKYRFTDRYKRQFKETVPKKGNSVPKKRNPRLDKIREEKNREDKKNNMCKTEFERLWKQYPESNKHDYCLMKFKALWKKEKFELFKKVTDGYLQFLEHKRINENFPQRAMNLSTWLNNWEGDKEKYIGFKYEPPL